MLERGRLQARRSGSYSQFPTEMLELGINLAYVKFLSRRKNRPRPTGEHGVGSDRAFVGGSGPQGREDAQALRRHLSGLSRDLLVRRAVRAVLHRIRRRRGRRKARPVEDTLLVTGAQGFIGRAMVVRPQRARLAGHGARSVAAAGSAAGGCRRWCRETFGEWSSWRTAIVGADVVIHLASAHLQVDLPESAYWETNVKSLRPFLEAARAAGVKHFIHTSSVGVHGTLAVVPGNEDSPLAPENLYEQTKRAGEAEVVRFLPEAPPMGVTIVRPAWVYGPGDPRTERILGAVARGGSSCSAGAATIATRFTSTTMSKASRTASAPGAHLRAHLHPGRTGVSDLARAGRRGGTGNGRQNAAARAALHRLCGGSRRRNPVPGRW